MHKDQLCSFHSHLQASAKVIHQLCCQCGSWCPVSGLECGCQENYSTSMHEVCSVKCSTSRVLCSSHASLLVLFSLKFDMPLLVVDSNMGSTEPTSIKLCCNWLCRQCRKRTKNWTWVCTGPSSQPRSKCMMAFHCAKPGHRKHCWSYQASSVTMQATRSGVEIACADGCRD